MPKTFKSAALALLAPVMVLTASPALADPDYYRGRDSGWHHGERKRDRWEERRGDRYRPEYRGDNRSEYRGEYRGDNRDDYRGEYRTDYRSDYRNGSYYGEPVYANTRTWRGDDGRTYCRRSDGTTGLIVGGVAGALIGREVAGRRGDRTVGAILGAAGGALLGRAIERNGSNNGYQCR